MKINIEQIIRCKNKELLFTKFYESEMQPQIGNLIHDPALSSIFKTSTNVIKFVSFDFSTEICNLVLEPINTDKTIDEIEKNFNKFGWKK